MKTNLETLKYPIGRFQKPDVISDQQITEWIKSISNLPANLRVAVAGLTDHQLDTVYRPDGWTLRQVVHHLSDSHLNAYVRFKLALTEDNPVIRPYKEDKWAELPEAKHGDIDISLRLLENLHEKWVLVLEGLRQVDFQRAYIHPEHNKSFSLAEAVALYAWHGEHHLGQIVQTKEANNW